jgi:xanthine dehydrogenase YagS FAD-binding subunit
LGVATAEHHPLVRQRYPALADAAAASPSPQIRNVATLGGNLLQRPRCWYFRSAEHHCLRKGGSHRFAISGQNRYHAIFDNRPCAIVHPSTAATVLVALGATLELAGASGSTRRVGRSKRFSCHRRATSRAHRSATRGESSGHTAENPAVLTTEITTVG